MKIILGSASENRQIILREMGLDFEVRPANIDEKAIRLNDPNALTMALARAKAKHLDGQFDEPVILITADQVVTYQGQIREKPRNAEEARKFLESYNHSPAKCHTAVVVTNAASGKQAEGTEVSTVYFQDFSDEEVNELIKSGEVYKYAGGFTVRGDQWRKHIQTIDGHEDNVLGLPKELTRRLIEQVK